MKTKLQLQQTATLLLNMKDIGAHLQPGCPEQGTMDLAVAAIFSSQVPAGQYDEFIAIYDEVEAARLDTLYRRNDSEVEA